MASAEFADDEAGRLRSLSRALSYVLRHRPESVGLGLDAGGWASVDELIARFDASGRVIDRSTLEAVVASNDKQRFAFSDDGVRIRAQQGHSLPVELGLVACAPPPVLYHGTAERFLTAIEHEGLRPQARQHVHLSATVQTARAVGRRHGRPAVLAVAAAELHAAGGEFFVSGNGVWLTAAVPARHLSRVALAS